MNFIENFVIAFSLLLLVAIFGSFAIRAYQETKAGKHWIEDDPEERSYDEHA